jgi:hypothetical protein
MLDGSGTITIPLIVNTPAPPSLKPPPPEN